MLIGVIGRWLPGREREESDTILLHLTPPTHTHKMRATMAHCLPIALCDSKAFVFLSLWHIVFISTKVFNFNVKIYFSSHPLVT